jgi:hypothetical protein
MFDEPTTFTDAVHYMAEKKLLPSTMTSEELKTLSKQVREQSFFSARNMLTDRLQDMKDQIERIMQPFKSERGVTEGQDISTARLELRNRFEKGGYLVDPKKLNTIEDLASDARLNLVLKTNVQMAQSFGFKRASQDEDVLDEYPAYELVRAEDRKVPREWEERWNEAGEACGLEEGDGWTSADGRMVALVNHPIWEQLGSSELFDDAFDNDRPPFAFNSGMDWDRVGRDDAVELGIIGEDEKVEPEQMDFGIESKTA